MSPDSSLTPDIEVRRVDTWNVAEIADLYRAGGWWQEAWDEAAITPLIAGSMAFVVAIDRQKAKAVGMGRLISDGVSDGYIQDLVVLPRCRKSGIGGKIVSTLVAEGKKKGLGWIGLIAEPGSERFYGELGFQPMQGHIPMLYKGGE